MNNMAIVTASLFSLLYVFTVLGLPGVCLISLFYLLLSIVNHAVPFDGMTFASSYIQNFDNACGWVWGNYAMDLTPLWLTLKVAGVATLVTFVVGVNLAFLVARRKFWGREGLDAFCTLPLVLPPTVLGYYLIVLIGRQGWLGHWLQEIWGISLIFTWQGAVLAAAVVSLPPDLQIGPGRL